MRHRLASVEDLAEGKAIAVDVGEKRVAVFRHEDEWFALDETCPHRGGPLHEGTIQSGVLYCPWHQWQFELRTGCSPLNPLSRVRTYAVIVEDGAVWVDL
ncbi:MAG TPA: Rieske 2Fe-2S domain-containing protein [Vicinamibacteria bacterium]|nr:Rieske 2Fe-2S domain-containing protein [Vicinamibacteria bacterium]